MNPGVDILVIVDYGHDNCIQDIVSSKADFIQMMHSGDKTTKMKGNIIQDADADRYWHEDFCQLLSCTYKLHF